MTQLIPSTPKGASINRIRIVDLPGIPLDDTVRGALAYHLLSGPALIRYAQASAEDLRLPQALQTADPELSETRQALPRAVDAALHHPEAQVRRAAAAIARRLGRNLAYIILTLHRGDQINREARPDWDAAEWQHWSHIRRFWLGGGIVSGELGQHIVTHANEVLQSTISCEDIIVARSPRPGNMALLGAARYLPQHHSPEWHALCVDFGQTSAKCAVSTVTKGRISKLVWLPDQAVPWQWRNDPTARRSIDGRDVLDFVTHAITTGVSRAQAHGLRLTEDIAISIAAYTTNGMLRGNGIYARMCPPSTDVRPILTNRILSESGGQRRCHIMHDGTAAATLHAGTPRSAVIVIGTALGVGFPPENEAGLLGIAPDLTID